MPDQIYDKGFKRELKKKKYFIHFLRKYVNLPLADTISEGDLISANTENEGNDFRSRRSDIVFRIERGTRNIYFYVMLELQTRVDFTMPMRLFLYMSDLIRKNFIDANKEEKNREGYHPPAVIPIVFYSGRNRWTAESSFKKYTYDGEIFDDHVIDFQYYLVSLRNLDVSQLEGTTGLDVILLFAKCWLNGDYQEAIEYLKEKAPELDSDDRPDVGDFVSDVFGPQIVDEGLSQELKDAFAKGDVDKMDAILDDVRRSTFEIEEKGKREGIEVGIKEGEIRAKREMARRMLHSNLQMEMIMEVTGLSASEIEELKNE